MRYLILIPLILTTAIAHAQTEREWQAAILPVFKKIDPDADQEYLLPDRTRVDIMAGDHAIEIDFDHKMYEGIGQALYYGEATDRISGVLLLPKGEDEVEQKYIDRFWVATSRVRIDLWTVEPSEEEYRTSGVYELIRWRGPDHRQSIGHFMPPQRAVRPIGNTSGTFQTDSLRPSRNALLDALRRSRAEKTGEIQDEDDDND